MIGITKHVKKVCLNSTDKKDRVTSINPKCFTRLSDLIFYSLPYPKYQLFWYKLFIIDKVQKKSYTALEFRRPDFTG